MLQLVFAALTLASISLRAEPELKGTPSELAGYLQDIPRVITLEAKGEIEAEADQAEVSLLIRSENKSLKAALQENEGRRGAIEQALTKKGIPAANIRSQKFSSTPETGLFSGKVKNYKVTSVMGVILSTEKQFQEVAGIIDPSEEIDYLGIEFRNKESKAYEAQVFAQACEAAGKKKAAVESALNVRLVPVNFIDNPGVFQPLYGAPMESDTRHFKAVSQAMAPPPPPSRPNFDRITYVKTIQVEYKMVPAGK